MKQYDYLIVSPTSLKQKILYLMDEEKPYLINAYTCQILNQ